VLSNEYVAGLFDGEGCIGAKRHGETALTLTLTISNSYLPVLQELRETLGYGYILSQRPRTRRRKPCYEWRTRDHKQVLDFIRRVKGKIRIKREALAEVESAIRGHKHNENSGSLENIDQEFLVPFHHIMPLSEVGRMLGVHPKSIWRRLGPDGPLFPSQD